jgi:hypothetical protein
MIHLVGGINTPLKNMNSSVGIMTFPIYCSFIGHIMIKQIRKLGVYFQKKSKNLMDS